ncbi:uncharacterized protein LY89DRAFT_742755 [Mollisia scopiformis]|uniref:Uncharacterized protein n=1 Tax=Mollisia scopiformis TaxID=149040 RepID=A0A132B541_MOLSC|nr:uncharacterized protein LY89DRAFT_742755 [Mollisia scopiformis]KUJ07525.1 hypothetical protein LY89DRAFT_742755 [Mollisia scopiformis]
MPPQFTTDQGPSVAEIARDVDVLNIIAVVIMFIAVVPLHIWIYISRHRDTAARKLQAQVQKERQKEAQQEGGAWEIMKVARSEAGIFDGGQWIWITLELPWYREDG